jgi:redox-sensitive bicupin YhaK (pirin superfamily)
LVNDQQEACDILLFGGEHYQEPIVAKGPFVMNSSQGIADAYKDFSAGKYGNIDYDQQRSKA